jgi:TonB family protein
MDSTLILRYLESVAVRPVGLMAVSAALLILFRVKSAAARHAAWTLVTAGMLCIAVTQPVMPWVALRVIEAAPMAGGTRGPGLLTVAAQPVAAPLARPFPSDTVLATLWATGALLLLGRLAYGYGSTLRMVRAAREIEPGVWESDWIAAPVTVATKIVLPVEWREWSAEKRDAVLAHERAHVRRHDWAVAVMAAVNRAVFWFHPLAWWLERRVASLAEEACDDAALAEVGSREAYAQALVEIAASVKRGPSRVVWEAVPMASVAEVRTRVERILDEARELSRGVSWRRWAAMSGCALPVVWLASAVHLARVEAATPIDTPLAIEQEQDAAGREARLAGLREKLRELDAEIARFKSENMGKLPEQFQATLAQLQTAQIQVGGLNESLNRLQRQKMQLETQLQNTTTLMNYGRASSDRVRGLNQRILDLQSGLAAAHEIYTPSHPQIKKIEASLAAIEREMELAQEQPPENPAKRELELQGALNLLKTQIQMTNLEMEEKVNQVLSVNRAIKELSERIESSPQKEQRYAELMREYRLTQEQLTESATTGPALLSRADPEPAGIQGKVEIAVTIGTDGVARDMQVIHSPDPALNKKAIECVAKWRFRPATRNGQAVTAFASVEVAFK